jgi:hypothetical protein
MIPFLGRWVFSVAPIEKDSEQITHVDDAVIVDVPSAMTWQTGTPAPDHREQVINIHLSIAIHISNTRRGRRKSENPSSLPPELPDCGDLSFIVDCKRILDVKTRIQWNY